MNVKSMQAGVIPFGLKSGRLCFSVVFDEKGEEKDWQEVVSAIRKSGYKEIMLVGSLSEYPEIKSICEGMVLLGFTFTVVLPASDQFAPLARIQNTNVFLTAKVPNAKKNEVAEANFLIFRENDQLFFEIKDVSELKDLEIYLKSKNIGKKVTVVLGVKREVYKDILHLLLLKKTNLLCNYMINER